VHFYWGREKKVKTENVELVRTIITELAESGRIKEGSKHDVHDRYQEENPIVEGDFLDMGGWVTRHECGTAACIAGWVAQDPRGQAAGLTLEPSNNHPNQFVPVYGRYRGMDAKQMFMGFRRTMSAYDVFGADNQETFDSFFKRLDKAVARERELTPTQ
jgi:hypothetical protein